MSHALFGGSFGSDDNPPVVVNTRRTSRTGSLSIIRRASRGGSISHLHVHDQFMNEALADARVSLTEGGIPIGCVLVRGGRIVGRGHNRRLQNNSSILHAELDCLQSAGRQSASFYSDCTMYLTHTPCSMCAGAIRFYGIPKVIIGDDKLYRGDIALLQASGITVEVIDSNECHEILGNYIKQNPIVWNENIAHE